MNFPGLLHANGWASACGRWGIRYGGRSAQSKASVSLSKYFSAQASLSCRSPGHMRRYQQGVYKITRAV
jgi:ribosomal protein L37AE/L43A